MYSGCVGFILFVQYVSIPLFSLQALLLHGSLPEDEQDVSMGFGDSRANSEQQLVLCPPPSSLYIHFR